MPADYVNKLARMFQDIKVSEDLNQEFQDKLKEQGNSVAGMRLHADILCRYIDTTMNSCLFVRYCHTKGVECGGVVTRFRESSRFVTNGGVVSHLLLICMTKLCLFSWRILFLKLTSFIDRSTMAVNCSGITTCQTEL